MQLEVAQLQQLYTLFGFLDDTGPVGWGKITRIRRTPGCGY